MADISRAASFGKLAPLPYKAIEGATVFCKLRGNPFVELQHWLQQILNNPDSDLHRIIRHYELDTAALATDITNSLDRLPRGAASISDISTFIDTAVERGWLYASLMFKQNLVRSGHLIIGLLKQSQQTFVRNKSSCHQFRPSVQVAYEVSHPANPNFQ